MPAEIVAAVVAAIAAMTAAIVGVISHKKLVHIVYLTNSTLSAAKQKIIDLENVVKVLVEKQEKP